MNNYDDKFNLILQQLQEIQQKENMILKQIQEIKIKLDTINISCNGMDNHINFVNNVYTTIRSPLDFLINRISYIQGGTEKTLSLPPTDFVDDVD